MKFQVRLALVALLLSGFALPGWAQGMGKSQDPSGELSKLFPKDAAFTAKAEINAKMRRGQQMTMELVYSMLDGKVRTEIDMTKMKSPDMPPQAMAQMKQMGMGEMVNIVWPEKKVVYIIYPGLKAYCEMPLPEAKAAGEKAPEPKVEKTELGRETVDGHPCVKSKVIITDEKNRKIEALVWEATDLKNFPIQSEMTTEDGTTVKTLFKEINQTKPDAAKFAPPADFKKYASMQELMMANMQRMMGGAGAE